MRNRSIVSMVIFVAALLFAGGFLFSGITEAQQVSDTQKIKAQKQTVQGSQLKSYSSGSSSTAAQTGKNASQVNVPTGSQKAGIGQHAPVQRNCTGIPYQPYDKYCHIHSPQSYTWRDRCKCLGHP